MITKEDFILMTDDDAIVYIENHYCIDDINDVCEGYVFESFDFDEEICEEILEDYQPFGYVIEEMDGVELKEFLYDNIVKQCEEIEDED